MKTFIHIGLPKTGTTFLQNVVFPALENITLITTPITYYNEDFVKLKSADDSLLNHETLKESIINQCKGENILISDEFLSGFPMHLCNINRSIIAKRLQYIFPDATIIIFLRGQKDILYSLHNQYIKIKAGTKRIGEFYKHPQFAELFKTEVGRKLETPFPYYTHNSVAHLDTFLYFELISLYQSLFKNVEIFLYEDLLNKPKETLLKLSNITGKNYSTDIEKLINKKINKSLNQKELEYELFHRLAKFVVRKRWITKIMFPLYYQFYIKSLKNRERKYIDKVCKTYFTENNRKLLSQLNIPIDKYPDNYYF